MRISSPELHVSDTCFLHERYIMERYVTTTYRLHELHMLQNLHQKYSITESESKSSSS